LAFLLLILIVIYLTDGNAYTTALRISFFS
jgi:hypothetical protein